MKNELLKKVIVAVILATVCTLNICAKAILPYGQFTKKPWQAKYLYALNSETGAAANWYTTDFDDSKWGNINGPICNTGCSYIDYSATAWPNTHSSYWIRRNFTIDSIAADKFYTLHMIYDDYCEVYINGELIYSDGTYTTTTKSIALTDKMISNLKKGNNVIAVKASDTGSGDSYIDFGIYEYDADDFLFGRVDTEITIDNDKEYPWIPDTANLCFTNGNSGKAYTTSTLSLTFDLEYKSEISFDWLKSYEWEHFLTCYIDGKLNRTTTSSLYQTQRFFLDAGKHTISISDSIGNNGSTDCYSRIKNLNIKAITPIDTVVIAKNSKKLTFNNNEAFPWIAEDGYIQSSNYGHAYSASSFSTTFTIEKPSMLSFERTVSTDNNGDYNNYLYLIINNKRYHTDNNNLNKFTKHSVILEPGTYTVEWKDTITNSTSAINHSRVRNICLSDEWLDVTIETAGTLGVELLNRVTLLADVELLRVTGKLNEADWRTISYLKNIVGLDLLDTDASAIPGSVFTDLTKLSSLILPRDIKTIPSEAMRYLTNLKYVKIPEGVTSIENDAFYNTGLIEIDIPSSVEYIGEFAFENSSLEKLNFPENSQLNTIESYAFINTNIDSIILPTNVTRLGYKTFAGIKPLKYVELPAYVESYNNTFSDCPNIKTIICKAATAPSNTIGDLFNAIDKTAVTLRIPTFAIMDYRLDPYWHQFTSIEGGVKMDYYNVADTLTLNDNLRPDGKPSFDLNFGGKLIVGGNAPMITKLFNIFINDYDPAVLLNNSIFKADSVNIKLSVSANKWYFITPLYDVKLKDVTHSENASFVFRYYDAANRATNGTGNNWKNVNGNKLHAGMGYIFQCSKTGTITFPAEVSVHSQIFRTTDVTAKLEEYPTEIAANKNWNYIGNPYPTYYDIYYLGFTAPITVWTGNTYRAYSIADDELALYPMQTFFVQKPEGVDSIIFHKEGRLLTSAIDRKNNIKARKDASASPRFLFNMQIAANDTLVDETRVVINEKASTGYELQSDASKFMSLKSEVPQIFTIDNEGNSYAINERPLSDGSIALGYNVSRMGFYTISATGADGKIELTDNLLNKSVDITQESYMFHSGATAGNNTTRFTLKVTLDNNGLTSIDTPTATTTVTAGKGVLNIVTNESTSYTIYTTDGQTAAAGETDAATTVTLPAGTYIVKANDKIFKAIVF